MTSPKVAVVGGGIAGLTAAYRLRRLLGPAAEIVVFEQTRRLGGKLRTVELAGHAYDIGAEAFLARREEVPALAHELGVAEEIVPASSASARLRAGGATCAIPSGTAMGIPASAEAVRGVLSESGLAAVRSEPDLPRPRLGHADVAVGELLRARLGDEVVDRLVEPLLGGVYAGSADSLGLRATMPALAAALDAGAGSISAAAAECLPPSKPGEKSPVFASFRCGYRTLIDELVRASHARIRQGLPVRSLARSMAGEQRRWRLQVGSAPASETHTADAVVLAVPPPPARRLLAEVAPQASRRLAEVELASMVVVGLALPPEVELPDASGVLLARGERHRDGTPFTAKAFTFSSRKWPHLDVPNRPRLVRASIGRAGQASALRTADSELLRRVRADLVELTGISARPLDSVVCRWGGGLPQYGGGHLDLTAEVERAVAELPGLAMAGAVLHGVGVPACIATGESAARGVAEHLLANAVPGGGTIKPWHA